MEPQMVRERGIFRINEDVIGKRVVNLEGQDLGKIEDVVVDASNARVSYAILSFGGFMGIGFASVRPFPTGVLDVETSEPWAGSVIEIVVPPLSD